MRTTKQIEDEFIAISKKMVKKTFYKKAIAKLTFSDEEMEKIKELDGFLKEHCMDNSDELERSIEKPEQYFCIAVRMKMVHKGTEYARFFPHFFNIKDFEYKKCEYYIAKCIYQMAKNRHSEVYHCVNLLRARYNEYGICVPERKQKNICSSSLSICRFGFA